MEGIYMIPSRSKRLLSVFIPIAYLLLVVSLVFSVLQALTIRRTTGILEVKTSDNTSAITISANNTQAASLGTGSARVRLKPGNYYVMAQTNGLRAAQTVTISLHQTTKITLQLASITPVLPSPASITFVNTAALLNNGLSSTQVTNLKQLFFTYAPSAKIISINIPSIEPGARDPSSATLWFSLTFTGSIDESPYNATVEYSGLDTTKLTLTNPASGAVLFSGQLPAVPTTD